MASYIAMCTRAITRCAFAVLVAFEAISASAFCVHGANAGCASHFAIEAWIVGLAWRAS